MFVQVVRPPRLPLAERVSERAEVAPLSPHRPLLIGEATCEPSLGASLNQLELLI